MICLQIVTLVLELLVGLCCLLWARRCNFCGNLGFDGLGCWVVYVVASWGLLVTLGT